MSGTDLTTYLWTKVKGIDWKKWLKEHVSTLRDVLIILVLLFICTKDLMPSVWKVSDEHNEKIFVSKAEWMKWVEAHQVGDKEYRTTLTVSVQTVDHKVSLVDQKLDAGFSKVNTRIDQLFTAISKAKHVSADSHTNDWTWVSLDR